MVHPQGWRGLHGGMTPVGSQLISDEDTGGRRAGRREGLFFQLLCSFSDQLMTFPKGRRLLKLRCHGRFTVWLWCDHESGKTSYCQKEARAWVMEAGRKAKTWLVLRNRAGFKTVFSNGNKA